MSAEARARRRTERLGEALAAYDEAGRLLGQAGHHLASVGLWSCGQKQETEGAVALVAFLAKRARQRAEEG